MSSGGFKPKWGPRPFTPNGAAQVYKLSLDDWLSVRRLVDKVLESKRTGIFARERELELNTVWKNIGDKMGFNWRSARDCPGQSSRYVLAFPKEVFKR